MARDGIGLYRHKGAEQWVFKFNDPQSGKWREKSTGQTGKREAWAVKTKSWKIFRQEGSPQRRLAGR
jgi:hypothetical protein